MTCVTRRVGSEEGKGFSSASLLAGDLDWEDDASAKCVAFLSESVAHCLLELLVEKLVPGRVEKSDARWV